MPDTEPYTLWDDATDTLLDSCETLDEARALVRLWLDARPELAGTLSLGRDGEEPMRGRELVAWAREVTT